MFGNGTGQLRKIIYTAKCGGVAAYGTAKSNQESRLSSTREAAIKLLYLALLKVFPGNGSSGSTGARHSANFMIGWPERMEAAKAA